MIPLKFSRGLTDLIVGYKVIHREKKRAAIQSMLDCFFRKPKTPVTTLPASSSKLISFQNLP
jgi:hypothetical protein